MSESEEPQEEEAPRQCICSFSGLPTAPPSRPCGYCKGNRPGRRVNIGAHFYYITPSQYEILFNRQWRRCGKYYYQPQNHDSCCPQYSIRLDATRASVQKRSHKRVQRLVEHWVRTGERTLPTKKRNPDSVRRSAKKPKSFYDRLLRDNFSDLNEYLFFVISDFVLGSLELSIPPEIDRSSLSSLCSVRFNFQSRTDPERGQLLLDFPLALSGRIRSFAAAQKKKKKIDGAGAGAADDDVVFVCPPRKIAEMIVSALPVDDEEITTGIRKSVALRSGHVEIWLTEDYASRLEQFVEESNSSSSSRSSSSNREGRAGENVEEEEEGEGEREREREGIEEIVEEGDEGEGEASAHADSQQQQGQQGEQEAQGEFDLDNEIIVIKTNGECTDDEFELYRKYQIRIHGDTEEDVTRERFTRVQCDTTLQSEIDPNLPMGGYGSFHLQYRVKKTNQLLAVSVIDILPHVFCSVYFFWDPDYRFLCLGVWSCLHEIEMVKEASLAHPEFKYYDLGYYVHTCPKMNYKAQFSPQELLCNETWKWVDLNVCRSVLDVVDYGRFAPAEEESEDAGQADAYDFSNQMVFYQGMALPFTNFVEVLKPEVIEKFLLFRHSVGRLASEVLYYLRNEDVIL